MVVIRDIIIKQQHAFVHLIHTEQKVAMHDTKVSILVYIFVSVHYILGQYSNFKVLGLFLSFNFKTLLLKKKTILKVKSPAGLYDDYQNQEYSIQSRQL